MEAPRDTAGHPLCLLSVHAHPDDEASKGAATVARYSDEGVRTVLVCCTGGEEGDILNPRFDTPEARADLTAVRRAELAESAEAIGYAAVHMLGYRDSGMAGTDANQRPDNFANADLDEAVGRLVAIIRAERPQVMLGYADDRGRYPHPDHHRVHECGVLAFDAAGDPGRYPDAGPPCQPLKLYYTGFSRRRLEALHAEFQRRGEESPYTKWFEGGLGEHAESFNTFVDVGAWLHRRRAALLAHRTQVDPEGHWMRLPDDVLRKVFPWEEFLLARSLVGPTHAPGDPEDDLFAGGALSRGLEDVVTVKYLSEEWLAEARPLTDERVAVPGVSARIEVLVTGAPGGDVAIGWVFADGKVAECRVGRLPEPDCTFTVAYADAVRINQGELDPNVAFMQGKLKISGDMAKVMELLPLTRAAGYLDWAASLRAVTET